LYLIGEVPPVGAAPTRYVFPVSEQHALLLITGDQRWADWTSADRVAVRAENMFDQGGYIRDPIRTRQNLLDEMKIVRNAVAHRSSESQARFEALVRRRLGYYAPNSSVGAFLDTSQPGVVPPTSFLDLYLATLLRAAAEIVPT
jgi:hypothetical protein